MTDDDPDHRPLGRLAITHTRDDVVAYLALPGTLAFARRLGSIRKDLVGEDPDGRERYRRFIELMKLCYEGIIVEETGRRPLWPSRAIKHWRD